MARKVVDLTPEIVKLGKKRQRAKENNAFSTYYHIDFP